MSSAALMRQAAVKRHAQKADVLAAFQLCRQLASQALDSLQGVPVPANSASSTSTSPSIHNGSPIHVACILERLPVMAGAPPVWETEYHDWLQQYRIAKGLRSDYPDVKHIYAPLAATRASSTADAARPQGPAAAVATDTQQADHAANTVPVTDDDMAGHMQSMRRALTHRLYLLVKQPLDGWHTTWQFPHAKHKTGESIRQTCERALHAAIGRKYPVHFVGNAPMAHMPLLLPDGAKLFFMSAQVVDDPWPKLTLPDASPAKDYIWATRAQAVQHIADARTADLLQRLLPE